MRLPIFIDFCLAVRTGLEPVTPCVTGMYSNQTELTHQFSRKFKVEGVAVRTGLEPVTPCVTGMYSNQTELTHQESGKRDSNSRPRPWQGRALPTELLPQNVILRDTGLRLSIKASLFCVQLAPALPLWAEMDSNHRR